MRISTFLAFVFFLVTPGAGLKGQTGAEYGSVTAATGAGTVESKKLSKSIGSVLDSVGKRLDKAAAGSKGDPTVTTVPATRSAAPGKAKQSEARSAAKPVNPHVVEPSQIRIGMSREELLRTAGEPFMTASGTDENGFAETFMYQGRANTVTVIVRAGKVAEISPMPEEAPVPPQSQSKAEQPK